MGLFSLAAHPLTFVGPAAPPAATPPRRTLIPGGPRSLHYRPRRFFHHGCLRTVVTTDGKESNVADGAVDSIDGYEVIDEPLRIPERDFTGTLYVPVYVMLPLGVIDMDCELVDPNSLLQQLRELKSANVDGVMVDCWWGIVEAHAPQQYNWYGYRQLFQMVRELQLKLQSCCFMNVEETWGMMCVFLCLIG